MDTQTSNLEKGLASATARPMIPSWGSSLGNTAIDEPNKNTPLQTFQTLVGICTPPSLTGENADSSDGSRSKSKRTRVDNVGLYQRTKEQERSNRIAYKCTSVISNSLYMIQILLAATCTALSAYKGIDPVVLTVVGALTTVVAGCLAWQKGQGVPQRYRKAQDQYQDLITEIEMAERSFLEAGNCETGDTKLDPRVENARLQKLFETARADQQANYPDLYVSTAGHAAGNSTELQKELDDAKAANAQLQNEMMAKIEELMAKLSSHAEAKMENVVESTVEK